MLTYRKKNVMGSTPQLLLLMPVGRGKCASTYLDIQASRHRLGSTWFNRSVAGSVRGSSARTQIGPWAARDCSQVEVMNESVLEWTARWSAHPSPAIACFHQLPIEFITSDFRAAVIIVITIIVRYTHTAYTDWISNEYLLRASAHFRRNVHPSLSTWNGELMMNGWFNFLLICASNADLSHPSSSWGRNAINCMPCHCSRK